MFGAIGAISVIQHGGTAKLSKSQIIVPMIDLRKVTAGLDQETKLKVMNWYQSYRKDKAKEPYDPRKLAETMESIQKELDEILTGKAQEGASEDIKEEDLFRED